MRRALPLIIFAGALAACGRGGEKSWPEVPLTGERVSVMTFNVENLFDARHDSGKSDHAFLPLSAKRTKAHAASCRGVRQELWREQCLHWDWSEKTLRTKLARLAGVILSVGGGRGPDILILQEVENARVLELLRAQLAPAGYRPGILVAGDDPRGIDVAVLARLPAIGEPVLHAMPRRGLRGILQAAFKLPGGRELAVFAVHLPAPTQARDLRLAALEELNRLQARLPDGRMAVAAGDFNFPADEDAAYGVLERYVRPRWLVSHRFGCAGCRGTNYYPPKEQWSFLDMILLSKNLHPSGGAPWVVLRDSVRVIDGAPQQKNRYGSPARFEPAFGTGVSDHWPLVLTLAERAS
ncbi:MAG: endonuclease/exonuclease/phosphatase family protein [Elusimicrobiota bacterium]